MNTLRKRPGGVFFKIFIALWCALLATVAGVWLLSIAYQNLPPHYGSLDYGHPGKRAIQSALSIAQYGGEKALIEWLTNKKTNSHPEVFALNDRLEDITGRTLPELTFKYLQEHRHQLDFTRLETASFGTLMVVAVRTETKPPPWFALFRTPWWGLLMLALLATVFVAIGLAWNLTAPIRKLHLAMQRASEGDLNVRVAPTLGRQLDEIGDLAHQYDAMTEKIAGLLARQKRLFHDVSHELRSPLARISVAIALAQKNPTVASHALLRIEKEVGNLDALVDELLTYARLDDHAPMHFEVTDAIPLIESIAEDAHFEGTHRHIAVTWTGPASCLINMQWESLGRAIENLVRNALRYSPDHGTVKLLGIMKDDHFELSISDEGKGMKPEEMALLFEPFVRGSDESTGTGFGLGLAIAKRAIERHGGTLQASNHLPHGLTMTIRLPVAST